MTLVELLIAMTLMLVVLGVATDALFNFGRSTTSAQLHTFSLMQNRVGMEEMTNLLRQATYPPDTTATNRGSHPIITNITPTSITFTSRGGGSPTIRRYKFALDATGTKLQMGSSSCTITAPSTSCVWGTPTMRDLITNVRPTSGGPCAAKGADDHVFRYYSTSSPTASLLETKLQPDPDPVLNAKLPAFLNSSAGSPAGSNDAALSQIDTVQISLFTQETAAGISNTCESLSARVNLRNLTFS